MVSKQKILIVDDDENIAELISLYLSKRMFRHQDRVTTERSALLAFDTYQSESDTSGSDASGH